jgi:hypothetical protein
VRHAGCFREPKAATAGKYVFDAGWQINAMADRHKHWIYPLSRTNYGAYGFSIVDEGDMAAFFKAGFFMLTTQPRFSTSNGRQVCKKANMACNP